MAKFTNMLKQGMDFLAHHEDEISSTLSQAKSLAEKNIGKGKITEAIDKVEQGFNTLKQNKDTVNSAIGLVSDPKKANLASIASLASGFTNVASPAPKAKPASPAPKPVVQTSPKPVPIAPVKSKEIIIDVTDPEDDFFETTLQRLDEAASKEAMVNPDAAMQALTTMYECTQETIRYCAEQETKREEIRAKRDHAIAKINAVTAILQDYLDKTFDERSTIFAEQFKALDKAMNADNTEAIGMVLNSINSLAAQSPFKALADINQVQQNLTDGAEWDI